MVLTQKLHEAFKGTVERITGPRTVSAFKEKGVLSVSEFVIAGDNLVSKCPPGPGISSSLSLSPKLITNLKNWCEFSI
jgi:hypothetical protein